MLVVNDLPEVLVCDLRCGVCVHLVGRVRYRSLNVSTWGHIAAPRGVDGRISLIASQLKTEPKENPARKWPGNCFSCVPLQFGSVASRKAEPFADVCRMSDRRFRAQWCSTSSCNLSGYRVQSSVTVAESCSCAGWRNAAQPGCIHDNDIIMMIDS